MNLKQPSVRATVIRVFFSHSCLGSPRMLSVILAWVTRTIQSVYSKTTRYGKSLSEDSSSLYI
jgi:hypothetical protein